MIPAIGVVALALLGWYGFRYLTDPTAADIAAAYGISVGDAERLVDVAGTVGCFAGDLAALIEFESGHDTGAVNSKSGASGLIQFMPDTATSLGTTTTLLRAMSYTGQMEFVRAYLSRYSPFPTFQSLCMAVFYPPYRYLPPFITFPDDVRAANRDINNPMDYIAQVEKRRKA
jgi:hypothetical protein